MTRKIKIAITHIAHLQVAPTDPRPKLAKELNACPPASLIVLIFALTTLLFFDTLTAQIKNINELKILNFNMTEKCFIDNYDIWKMTVCFSVYLSQNKEINVDKLFKLLPAPFT
ncbi:MAG: hypothetical protein WC223_12270 [Bacteroidales bacterium]